jgi:hypothetical protein
MPKKKRRLDGYDMCSRGVLCLTRPAPVAELLLGMLAPYRPLAGLTYLDDIGLVAEVDALGARVPFGLHPTARAPRSEDEQSRGPNASL